MPEREKYHSTADVAELYNVVESTVRRWIRQGLLPGSMKKSPLSHSDWMIPQSALDHFEEQRQAASQS